MKGKGGMIIAVSALAGSADALTGLFLMLAPAFTLGLMGVEPVPGGLVFIRYIGGFVFAVGGSYALGLAPVLRRGDWSELRVVWKVTAWMRLVICLFTAAAIAAGGLGPEWASVTATDGALALLQGGWLLAGRWPEGRRA